MRLDWTAIARAGLWTVPAFACTAVAPAAAAAPTAMTTATATVVAPVSANATAALASTRSLQGISVAAAADGTVVVAFN